MLARPTDSNRRELPVLSNRHRHIPFAIAVFTTLLLAGCDRQIQTAAAPDSHRETLERRTPGCSENGENNNKECASVTVEWEVFKGRPALNNAIRERLVRQLRGNGEEGQSMDSLEAVADAFLAEAARSPAATSAARWQLTGEAKRLSQRGDLLTVAIHSYTYTGGAHGLPVTRWLNWDLAVDKPVSLQQLLQPGRGEDFWRRAEEAHRRWLEKQDADGDFRRIWPFQKTADFRFDGDGMVLLYGVYQLAPYASGQVELAVPWKELRGVVRSEYLPERLAP